MDEIERVPGVHDDDWSLLQEIGPVYVCQGNEYDPGEYRFLVLEPLSGLTLVTEAGGRLEHIIEAIPCGLHRKRRLAEQDYKSAGAHYLNSYRAEAEARAARLAAAERARRDDDGWVILGHVES